EEIETLSAEEAARLGGRRVLVFRPAFGVATAWAYRALAARPENYMPADEAEARLAAWREGEARGTGAAWDGGALFNTLEIPVFAKYPALPTMIAWLRERHGLIARMSGSGSACFAVLPEGMDCGPVEATLREGFGP